MTNNEILEIVLEQLSYDMNCSQEVLKASGITVVEAGNHKKRRKFKEEPMAFGMLTLGNGTVIAARKDLIADLIKFKEKEFPLRLFEHFKMIEIDQLLNQKEIKMTGVSEYYLPDVTRLRDFSIGKDYVTKLYEGDQVAELFQYKGFDNALSYYIEGLRPDVIAMTVSINNQIVGMAGASADGENMWQIGVDVLEDHRQKGLATYLVSELTKGILELGKVPYYGTWSANIASRKTAIKCGYMPAWTEVY